jgi:hypothetical protein
MSAIKGMKFDMQKLDSQTIGYGPLILLLLCLGIIPGVFAFFYLKNVPYCPGCKKLIWERRPF